MRTTLIGALALLPALAFAQEQPPQGEGKWGVLVTQAAIITFPLDKTRTWSNDSDVDTKLIVFPTLEACNEARNIALTPLSYSLVLGTGGAGQAHFARTVTPCFKQ